MERGGVSFGKYCPKFNPELKENVRNFFGGRCVICGKTKEENNNERLSVHHVFTEKMACCESIIADMDTVRKRFPKEVAQFGNANFSPLEIIYIRMMTPLCRSHHSYVEGEDINMPFEQTKYRKYLANLIMNNYGGNCYDASIIKPEDTNDEDIHEV